MKRNFGLDIIRACAIIFVLLDHGWYFLRNPNVHVNILAVFGYIGVELFFVLSGFLIGQILLREFVGQMSSMLLKRFYIRRWFRTIPLYYALLFVFIVASSIVYGQWKFHPFHFIFLQNYFPKEIEFFGIAWSLSVEEWFYVLLPLFFISISYKNASKKHLLKMIGIAIMSISLARMVYVYISEPSYEMVRKSIFIRFDSLLVGVLLAVLKQSPSVYAFIRRTRVAVASLTVLFGCGFYYVYLSLHHILDSSFFMKTLGLTVVSIAIAGLIPYMEQNESINGLLAQRKLLHKAITTVSLTSYSLYLIHLEVFTIFIVLLSDYVNPYLLFILATFTTFLISYVVYRIYEKPIMNVRERFAPGQKYRVPPRRVKVSRILS